MNIPRYANNDFLIDSVMLVIYDSIVSLRFCELPCPFLSGFIFRNNNKTFFNKNILLSHVPINDRTNPDWLAHDVDVQQHDVAGA